MRLTEAGVRPTAVWSAAAQRQMDNGTGWKSPPGQHVQM
jgi:hypothetical protein